jgi:single-stranded DNA-binding protein
MTIDCATYGTIVRDAEVKTSKNNKQYARVSIRSGDGDNAQFVSIMYFGADAADLAPKLVKGAAIYCEGSLRLDEWTGQDGAKRSGLSVMSFHCRIAEIGRHKPARDPSTRAQGRPDDRAGSPDKADDFNDDISF